VMNEDKARRKMGLAVTSGRRRTMAASVNRDAPAEARGARATCCSAASIALRPARANVISSGSRSCLRRSVPVGSQKFAVSFLRRGVRAEKKPREPWTGPFTHTASRAMTRTRRADSAQPARDTADSTKQLKDTKRHLPGKSKLPRPKKSGRIPEEDHDHLLAKPKAYAAPPDPHPSVVRVESSSEPAHDVVRVSASPRRSPRLAVGPGGRRSPLTTAEAVAAATSARTPGLALPTQPGSFGTRAVGPDMSIGGAMNRGG